MLNQQAILSGRDLNLRFDTPAGPVHALRGVDVDVFPGEFVCLFGASGSGKSSLLNVLSGLETPTSGEVLLRGEGVSAMKDSQVLELRLRQVGLVFQENNLVSQFTAGENVQLVLRAQGHPDPMAESRRLLEVLGIGELCDRVPAKMSGGQRQRVGIARALAGDRPVLMCDEPTGALDRKNSLALFKHLRKLVDELGTSVFVATHDDLARTNATRSLVMADGRIAE